MSGIIPYYGPHEPSRHTQPDAEHEDLGLNQQNQPSTKAHTNVHDSTLQLEDLSRASFRKGSASTTDTSNSAIIEGVLIIFFILLVAAAAWGILHANHLVLTIFGHFFDIATVFTSLTGLEANTVVLISIIFDGLLWFIFFAMFYWIGAEYVTGNRQIKRSRRIIFRFVLLYSVLGHCFYWFF